MVLDYLKSGKQQQKPIFENIFCLGKLPIISETKLTINLNFFVAIGLVDI